MKAKLTKFGQQGLETSAPQNSNTRTPMYYFKINVIKSLSEKQSMTYLFDEYKINICRKNAFYVLLIPQGAFKTVMPLLNKTHSLQYKLAWTLYFEKRGQLKGTK